MLQFMRMATNRLHYAMVKSKLQNGIRKSLIIILMLRFDRRMSVRYAKIISIYECLTEFSEIHYVFFISSNEFVSLET